MRNAFGGAWTQDKLLRLNKYLRAYTTIFKGNPQARYFTTIYVDAFAGTGRIEHSPGGNTKGSAQIALEVEPSFDNYLFIERSKGRCRDLERLKLDYPGKANSIQVVNAEANEYLKDWCVTVDWSRTRAVLFLDPFGMQVEWSLLEAIAETHSIDVWLLFPSGMGVNRLLTRNEPPPEAWAARLTKVLGTDDWLKEFYPSRTEATLFGDVEHQSKDADYDKIAAFFVTRLKTIFTGVAENPLLLKTPTKNVPLFLLCFATGSRKESARKAALRIAKDILKR